MIFIIIIQSNYYTAKLLVNRYYYNLAQLLKHSTLQVITTILPIFNSLLILIG